MATASPRAGLLRGESRRSTPPRRGGCGFTLIELLVAISILALMAVLSWRGLDSMTQTQSRLQQRADDVLALQAGLSQWGADLDAMLVLPGQSALDWDGRALRLTRRASGTPGSAGAVIVAAWSRRDVDGAGQWLRWQSAPLRTRGDLQIAWAAAAQWAQNPGDDLKAREVRIVPLAQWQIFYFRDDTWTNPLSAAGNVAAAGAPGAAPSAAPSAAPIASSSAAPGATGSATAGAVSSAIGATSASVLGGIAGAVSGSLAALAASLPATGALQAVPQGVRLVLTLPPGQALSGTLTRDWVLPTVGGGKS